MSSVISFRTTAIEELKKIAQKKNISLAAITSEIIEYYVRSSYLISKYEMFNDGRKYIASAFDNVDSSAFDKIAEIGARECIRGAKMAMSEFTLENLLSYFRGWVEVNQLKLSEFNENQYIRWVCQTKMGKNYNEITSKCFKIVLEEFDFSTSVESFNEDLFELKFLKNRHYA